MTKHDLPGLVSTACASQSVGCRQPCDALSVTQWGKAGGQVPPTCHARANDCLAAQQNIKLHVCLTATTLTTGPLMGDQTAARLGDRVQFTSHHQLIPSRSTRLVERKQEVKEPDLSPWKIYKVFTLELRRFQFTNNNPQFDLINNSNLDSHSGAKRALRLTIYNLGAIWKKKKKKQKTTKQILVTVWDLGFQISSLSFPLTCSGKMHCFQALCLHGQANKKKLCMWSEAINPLRRCDVRLLKLKEKKNVPCDNMLVQGCGGSSLY